ncbi:hypothetical protein IWX50DRAFT_659895 [Phyllosticta citricarpa]|uniref:Zn(2)-C6 fungal-type domain-containing protein n=1 Tax=Phyllosticta citricarpa TaxID=55181 RepID=A0ABR1LBF2_9PEZI
MSAEPQHKKPASRRTHKKTRTGCAQCKQRRVKCDELKPTCSNCLKRSTVCSLQFSVPNLPYNNAPRSGPSSSTASQTANRSPTNLAPSPSSRYDSPNSLACFTAEDMEILHHYTCYTSQTFTARPNLCELWQRYAPTLGIHDPPLMRGILAMGAIHKAHTCPSRRAHLATVGTRYLNGALGCFRERLSNITRENCESLVVFSCFLCMFVLGSTHKLDSASDEAISTITFDDPSEWLRLIRGLPSILHTGNGRVYEWICETPFRLILDPSIYLNEPPLPAALQTRLNALRDLVLVQHPPTAPADLRAYSDALEHLRKCTAILYGKPNQDSVTSILIWPSIVPERYVECLKESRPQALLILAHYSSILKELDDYWWGKGWAKGIVQIAYARLPADWRPHAVEPMKELGFLRDEGATTADEAGAAGAAAPPAVQSEQQQHPQPQTLQSLLRQATTSGSSHSTPTSTTCLQ